MIFIRCECQRSSRTLVRGLCYFFGVLLFWLSSHRLNAHNPPVEYYDRNITVSLLKDHVEVHYRIEISQVSLFNLPKFDERIDTRGVKSRAGLEAACMERFKVVIPDQLLGFWNDKPIVWAIEKTRIDQQDSSHFHIRLRGAWLPVAGDYRLEISDGNFPGVPGPYRMTVDDPKAFTLLDAPVEPRRWEGMGVDPNKEHKAFVVFRSTLSATDIVPEITLPKEDPPPAPMPSLWQRLHNEDLKTLLSTNYGLWLLMLIALVHGAMHSMMPGHGKTMVAAYLIGERGTPRHAVLLGVVTTLTHTSAAFGIALLLRYVLPQNSAESVNTVLRFLGGLLIAGLGVWLFLQRLAGRSDHVHLFDLGHAHSHGEAPLPAEKGSTVRLILLGIAGGIIPCWGAIMWVIGCIATGQFWLALPVVLCFSIGLASILILIGLSVVYAGRFGKSRWSERRWFQRLFNERTVRVLPVVGAGLVVVIGLFLCSTSGIAGK